MNLAEGIIVAEHYRLLRQLGHGSFGDVWLAHNLLADIDVAIKFYGTLDQKGLEEFRNEFKIAYKLHHPNLLNINHFDVFENCPYLVMPYCENGSVSHQNGHMPEADIWKFILDVSGGLAFLHSQQPPIVHQDIKPDNILITSDGRYVISDFGISRSFRTQMSRTNNNLSSSGTIAYMGPERFSEKPMVVLASDIWAFGMTLYELMTGDVLWEGMGGCVQLNGARLPVIDGAFSEKLKKLVAACLAAETWNRPTAAQIHDFASANLQSKSVSAPWEHQFQQPQQERRSPQSQSAPITHYQTVPRNERVINKGNTDYITKQNDKLSKQKNLKRGLIAGAALIIAIALISGITSIISSISEEQAFVSCRSKQDYEQFIKDYPSSSYVETAKKRIVSLTPQESSQPESKQIVVETPPEKKKEVKASVKYTEEKPMVEETTKAIQPEKQITEPVTNKPSEDDRAYYSCVTDKDFHNYLSRFPNGKHRKAATERLTNLLNEANGNKVNLSGTNVPTNRIQSDMNTESHQMIPQQSVRRQVGISTNIGRGRPVGGYQGGAPRSGSPRSGGQRSGGQRSGGSSHRHSN